MRSPRKFLIVIGALCLGLLCIVYFTWRERDSLRLRTAVVREHTTVLQAELHRVMQVAAARPERPPAPLLVEAKEMIPARRPILRVPGLIDIARDNPGLWNEFISSKKAEFAQRYGPLFQSLGLSSEQRENFKVIMGAEVARSADIAAAADAKQLQREDPMIAALYKQSKEQMQAELATLVGERGQIELQEFERTIQVRGFADGLAVQLAATEPLSGQQADRLTRALASASAGFLKGGSASSSDLDWSRADEEVRAILSPTQFALWQQGTAHNRYGGSRRDVEFKKLYDQAVKVTKEPGAAMPAAK